MTITLLVIGKTNVDFVVTGIKEYAKRLTRYIRYDIVVLADVKGAASMSESQLKEAEADKLLDTLKGYDAVVLLDERGKELRSSEFAQYLDKRMVSGTKRLCFVVGGAYGYSDRVYSLYKERLSISKMTFSHQMIRLLFTEQLYRGLSILNGSPYHHE